MPETQTPADTRTYGQVIHDLLTELRPEDPAAYATTMREIAAVATAAARDAG